MRQCYAMRRDAVNWRLVWRSWSCDFLTNGRKELLWEELLKPIWLRWKAVLNGTSQTLLENCGLWGHEEYNIGKVFFSWVVGKLVIND